MPKKTPTKNKKKSSLELQFESHNPSDLIGDPCVFSETNVLLQSLCIGL